jgi:MscS family membrane protein
MVGQEVLAFTLWGNTLAQWFWALLIVLVTFFASKISYFLFEKLISLFGKKKSHRLDLLIISALRGPVVFSLFILALHFSLDVLFFSDKAFLIIKQVVHTLIIINVTWFVTRLLNSILHFYISPLAKNSSKTSKTAFPMIKNFVIFFVWLIALIVLFSYFGVDPTGIVAGLGIGGLAFALAAQDLLGNLFSGTAVIATKPFVVGDRIRIDSYDGFVREINMRTTIIETFGGTQVIIPNTKIANSFLENITREPRRRILQVLTLEYSTSSAKLEKAKKILQKIVKENLSTSDTSLTHFLEFDNSSINLQLIYWIEDFENIFQAQDEVNTQIKKEFEKANINFAFPTQTVHLKK